MRLILVGARGRAQGRNPLHLSWSVAAIVVWAATGVFGVVIALSSVRRVENLGGGFDLAIFTQYSWLLAHGLEPFNTINGKNLLGDHVEPGLALFAPLGVVGSGWQGLVVAQAILLALVAPVLFAISRAAGASPGHATIMPTLWLLSPFTYGPTLYEFHPETSAPLFLALAALGLLRGRPVLFVMSSVVAVSMKEDIALTVAMLGVVAVVLGHRRLGAWTISLSLAWFAISLELILPAFGVSLQDEYGPRFSGGRGDSLAGILRWAADHPLRLVDDVVSGSNVGILVLMALATIGLGLLRPLWLLVAAPSLLANFASAYPPQHSVWYQYYVVPWACIAIAAAVGAGSLQRRSIRLSQLSVVAFVLAAALLGAYAVGRVEELSSSTPGVAVPGKDEVAAAMARIPPHQAVAAPGRMAAALAQRREIYVLPLPFNGKRRGSIWTSGDLEARSRRIRWVIYDRTQPEMPPFTTWYRAVPDELRRRGFRIVRETEHVSVWRR